MTELDAAHDVARFPIQPEKLDPPPLGPDTLHRERLVGWLDQRIHHRAVLVVAEAGFGKTTLVADFASRTRLPTIWYRLDDEDRDPVAVLNYLVAAGRRLVPDFAPSTAGMLRDLGTAGVSHDVLVRTFVHELRDLGDGPIVLILDDLHHVDDVPEVRSLLREMLARAPERFTFLLSTRRLPVLPLSRLRTRGELAELTTEDLRFRPDETERLFREAYGQPLEADLSRVLTDRTQGWAATLQLVRTAVRERDPAEVRTFIRGLDGRSEDLHDFLAEEVVGDLEPARRRFLMRTSILQVVTPELATVVDDVDATEARDLIEVAERLGLLSRRGQPRWRHRYHPLVRDFLVDRLTRDEGSEAVRELHRAVARYADGIDWRLAAYHWSQAHEATELHRVLADSVAAIMGTGEFALADGYLADHPPGVPTAAFEIILSRLDFYRNRTDSALQRAAWASEAATGEQAALAQFNLASLSFNAGEVGAAAEAISAIPPSAAGWVATLSHGIALVIESTADGNLDDLVRFLDDLLPQQLAQDQPHFAGVTELNLAVAYRAKGMGRQAVDHGGNATSLLAQAKLGPELTAAISAEAWGHAHLGSLERARALLQTATETGHHLARAEALIEAATVELWYGSPSRAQLLLDRVAPDSRDRPGLSTTWSIARAELAIRQAEWQQARELLTPLLAQNTYASSGQKAHVLAVFGHALAGAREPGWEEATALAEAHAARQGADFWVEYSRLGRAVFSSDSQGGAWELSEVGPEYLDVLAWDIAVRIGTLSQASLQAVGRAATRNPERWRLALRAAIDGVDPSRAVVAAKVLEGIGEAEDVRRLRRLAKHFGKSHPDALLGKSLARHLAPRVFIEDLGRTSVQVGTESVSGSTIRRKVLSLLLFLLSRPGMAATRDQVLDALWPDHEPSDALNSLNQTIYFLRRVFEPDFDDELTAGYVHHRPDLVWLDAELISSRSQRCFAYASELGLAESNDAASKLCSEYIAPFALDFAYEDWASTYRNQLHSTYLELMERAIRADIGRGQMDRAMTLARRASMVDPSADEIQVLGIRLSRLVGAHAAAAERYQSYAAWSRDELGVEPPTLDDL